MDLDTMIKQSEDCPTEVVKPVMPRTPGTRKAISIYIGESSVFAGFIIEDKNPPRLVHDIKISGISISHVADLVPSGETFSLATTFAHAKERPDFTVEFSGEFVKTEEGYSGQVVLFYSGIEHRQSWELIYD